MDIAVYFSADARRAAAAATYRTHSAGTPPGTYRRTPDGSCPLGVLMRADGYGTRYAAPDSAYAASAIYGCIGGERDRTDAALLQGEIRRALGAFMQAWDGGEIASLAEALDVPPCDGFFARGGAKSSQTDSEPTAPRRRELRQAVRE